MISKIEIQTFTFLVYPKVYFVAKSQIIMNLVAVSELGALNFVNSVKFKFVVF